MLEIVFSDSACGGLKSAQNYGRGKYIRGCTSVFLSKHDGSEPTSAELEEAQKTAEERQRLEWETAIPMDGNPKDVFGLNLILSIGDISKDNFANKREQVINTLWSIYPGDDSDSSFDFTSKLLKTLKIIRERVAQGEDIRIWYSNQPDELCGLYWLMAELQTLEKHSGKVLIVKLPEYEYRDNNTVVIHTSWGEIPPGEWHRYAAFGVTATSTLQRYYAAQWSDLQTENAPLRAVLSGKLVSVPENIYDDFILREIRAEGDEFHEANVIGRILGKYQLGIGDTWLAHRIEKMIDDGKLIAISTPPKDAPNYHRRLKKNCEF